MGEFKSGYVNIIGRPNVGKSTLLNAIIGEKLAIVTSKAQTTRHRIIAVLTEPEYQIIFSDTPGIIKPAYELHQRMMNFVSDALEDADVLLLLADITQNPEDEHTFNAFENAFKVIGNKDIPAILVLNKIDTVKKQEAVVELLEKWKSCLVKRLGEDKSPEIIPISALSKFNLEKLLDQITDYLPEGPPYYDEDTLTDRPERFFVSEIIREKIILQFKQEIPYSTEIVILSFKEDDKIIRIQADIVVTRKSLKPILIGKGGSAIKRIGTEARKDIEQFLGKKVFLELFVKIREDWRNKSNSLNEYGY